MKFKENHKTGENQQLELMESFGKEIVETLAAFSNASGGTIIEK
jgi:predicted HTH transcriptional regulator